MDFSLLTLVSDVANITSSDSFLGAGTYRWMSPELFHPEKFGLKDARPTKSSDCYSFGMVMYEVLSGRVPFSKCPSISVVVKVLNGERPARPQGEKGMWFDDDIWSVVEHLWRPNPGDRPKIEDVLHLLEEVSNSWTISPPQVIPGSFTVSQPKWDPDSSTEGIPATEYTESISEETRDEGEASSAIQIGQAVLVDGANWVARWAPSEISFQTVFKWMDNQKQKALSAVCIFFFVFFFSFPCSFFSLLFFSCPYSQPLLHLIGLILFFSFPRLGCTL